MTGSELGSPPDFVNVIESVLTIAATVAVGIERRGSLEIKTMTCVGSWNVFSGSAGTVRLPLSIDCIDRVIVTGGFQLAQIVCGYGCVRIDIRGRVGGGNGCGGS